MLSSAIPGSASVEHPAVAGLPETITASFTQTSTERQVIETQLAPEPTPGDNLLLAVLSLESSTSSAEAQASMQRILELGVPQEAPTFATLEETPAGTDGQNKKEASDADATPTAEPGADEEPACEETGSAAYCIYAVVEGDTLSGIAQTFGVTGNGSLSPAELLAQSNKPDIVSSDHIEPGQHIRVPREPGIVHTVLFAESASEIAADYGVSTDAILSSPYNAIGGDGIVVIGQEIFIPDPTQLPVNEDVELTLEEPTPEPEATEAPAEEPTEAPIEEPTATEAPQEPTAEPTATPPEFIPPLGALDTPTPTPEPTQEPTATPEATEVPTVDATPVPSNGSSLFIWPVHGPISSYFGPSHPLGIDIDLYADPNADIVAARGGTVVFAGGDPCCSYGYYVIVDHGNGVQTLYAHFSQIKVSEGQQVAQGQLLGQGGRTGYATGNHLHFEIRVDGNVVDPLKYLP